MTFCYTFSVDIDPHNVSEGDWLKVKSDTHVLPIHVGMVGKVHTIGSHGVTLKVHGLDLMFIPWLALAPADPPERVSR